MLAARPEIDRAGGPPGPGDTAKVTSASCPCDAEAVSPALPAAPLALADPGTPVRHTWRVWRHKFSWCHASGADRYINTLAGATDVRMSAASWVETAVIVDANRDPVLSGRFDDLITEAGIVVAPVTADHARLARQAYRDFGKGRHPAGLNFGDCFSYALARATGQPLMFKGDDFALTDVTAVE